jgi:NAD+ synthase
MMRKPVVALDPSVFSLDAAAVIERLAAFIRDQRTALRRNGIVVPLSGGLDSSTVLLLCERAVGRERVTALLLPESDRSPDALAFARMLSDRAGIRTIDRDIAPALAALGVEPPDDERWNRLDPEARRLLDPLLRKSFADHLRGTSGAPGQARFARINARHRVRSTIACLVAEERNDLLVGCAHRSEEMLGLFVKFGVDDNADVMPLKNLYRTEILQLAAALGVPREIIGRTPNPEIIPGVSDKYRDILGLDSATLDLVLWGIERGLPDEEIASQLRLGAGTVEEMREVVALTRHMREPSRTLSRDER